MNLSEARRIVSEAALHEVFDKPYPFRVKMQEKRGVLEWTAEWRGAGGVSNVSVEPEYRGRNNGEYGMVFEVGDRISMTGKGDSFRVMATVIAALREILLSDEAQRTIRVLKFDASADEKGRVRLYKSLTKKLARSVGMSAVARDDGGWVQFVLTRQRELATA